MFAAISAISLPSFRIFSHLFMASDSALEERFLSTKTISCTRRDALGPLVFIQGFWIDPFGWLSRYCWLCLRCSFPGANLMLPKNLTHAIRVFRHILIATMPVPLPVRGTLRIQNIALDSDIFPETSSHLKIGYHGIELLAP
jgi:hypothetical protein